MYNVGYTEQLERFRRETFGSLDPRELPASVSYLPPADLEVIECEEDSNGEWIPKTVNLRK